MKLHKVIRHMSTNFDELSQTARNGQSPDAMNALWRAVYQLERWHFVGRGSMPNVQPFIGVVNNQPFLMAFTDEERAHAFAVKNKLSTSEGAYSTVSTSVSGAIAMAHSLQRQGVFGILFNDGPHGFFAPLSNVATMYEHCVDQLPPSLWDPFVKGVRDAITPTAGSGCSDDWDCVNSGMC